MVARIPRVIYTDHGRDGPLRPREQWLNRLLSALVQGFVAVSAARREDLATNEGISRSRIQVIYNGVELIDESTMAERKAAEAKIGLPPDRLLIGIVARLEPIKDHANLLRALRRVISEVPDAYLLVIGDGPEGPGLRELAVALGVQEHIRFLGFRDDVPLLLQLLDVFVLCSLAEGLSMTLVEACAASLPIVATAVGGNPEVIRDGWNGRLVPSGDPDALAAAIIGLLTRREEAASMGRRARQAFEQSFSSRRMVAGYEGLFLGERPACGRR
jgi:glycosyltransferase involved in cell wall biosynthesis